MTALEIKDDQPDIIGYDLSTETQTENGTYVQGKRIPRIPKLTEEKPRDLVQYRNAQMPYIIMKHPNITP